MKKFIVINSLIFLFLTFLFVSSTLAEEMELAKIKIDPKQRWTNSDINIEASSWFLLIAEGETWKTEKDVRQVAITGNSKYPSEGAVYNAPLAGTAAARVYELPGAPLMCLIGKIGINGTPFYIGSKRIVSGKIGTGNLYLGLNDCDSCYQVNEGEIVVRILKRNINN